MADSIETWDEQVERLTAMAADEDGLTWDLSPNDRAAISKALTLALDARETVSRVERAEEWAATLVERAWLDRRSCACCEGEGTVLCEGSAEETEECDACAGSGVIDALTLLGEARAKRAAEPT